MKNIACKLIYNNGGEGVYVGFKERCDIKNIIYNIETGSGRWCSQAACPCRKYYDSGFKQRKVEDYPCNESRLFELWEWNPGAVFKTGEHFTIKHSGVGKYAILTTRFPDSTEAERKIVGFLKIKHITDYHYITGIKKWSLRLPLEEAKELNFWNYHINDNTNIPMWRSKSFRYITDDQVAAILHDLRDIVQNVSTKSLIGELLEKDFPTYAKHKPIVKGALDGKALENTELQRKYGKGGESKEHKNLKEFIAKNPKIVGLNKSAVNPFQEHRFLSGDRVDILFEAKKGGLNKVVEIELDNVEPGIHQAIKYRTLRCSQLGLKLTDKNISAAVVAWKFSDVEVELCKKYGIEFIQYKL